MTLEEAHSIVEKKKNADGPRYGDGATIFTPTGADGQFATNKFPICNAIMHNNQVALHRMMYKGIQPDTWEDPEDTIDFNDEYEREFKEDYALVFNGNVEEDINGSLQFMLNYDNEFFIAPFDIMNLFHAGREACSPEVLKQIVLNYVDASDSRKEEAFDGFTWEEVLRKIEDARVDG